MQRKLRDEIRAAKLAYKQKVESQFRSGQMRDAWRGLKTLTGQNTPCKSRPNYLSSDTMRTEFADELNDFYCRFERVDLRKDLSQIVIKLRNRVLIEECRNETDLADLEIQASVVESAFKRVNPGKASGPDNICGRLLKSCSAQLCSVFSQLFSWSLRDCKVPSGWKKIYYMSCS